MKASGATSDGIVFVVDGRPRSQKDKSKITCFRCGVSGHYSTENVCKQEYIDKYNATEKVDEARQSSSPANNDKRITDTPVEETGTQMIITGLKMDGFGKFTLLPDVT